jgi:uncharacterized repeat protein (TIGR01451 family)
VAATDPATGQVTFGVTIANAGDPSVTAYGLTLTDTLPLGLVRVSNTSPAPPPGVVNRVFSATPDNKTLTLTIESMAPGTSYSFEILTRGDGTVGPGTSVINPVTLTASDLPASINGNPDQGDPNSRRTYQLTSSAGVTVPPVLFTKTANPSTITIKGNVDFTINVTVAAGTALYGVTVGDTLPDGLVLRAPGITYGGNPSGSCGPATPSGGGTTGPLTLGTLSNPTNAACVYLVLVAAVSDGTVPAETSDSAMVTNIATLGYTARPPDNNPQTRPTKSSSPRRRLRERWSPNPTTS